MTESWDGMCGESSGSGSSSSEGERKQERNGSEVRIGNEN